jgi:hypothetical protein
MLLETIYFFILKNRILVAAGKGVNTVTQGLQLASIHRMEKVFKKLWCLNEVCCMLCPNSYMNSLFFSKLMKTFIFQLYLLDLCLI